MKLVKPTGKIQKEEKNKVLYKQYGVDDFINAPIFGNVNLKALFLVAFRIFESPLGGYF